MRCCVDLGLMVLSFGNRPLEEPTLALFDECSPKPQGGDLVKPYSIARVLAGCRCEREWELRSLPATAPALKQPAARNLCFFVVDGSHRWAF